MYSGLLFFIFNQIWSILIHFIPLFIVSVNVIWMHFFPTFEEGNAYLKAFLSNSISTSKHFYENKNKQSAFLAFQKRENNFNVIIIVTKLCAELLKLTSLFINIFNPPYFLLLYFLTDIVRKLCYYVMEDAYICIDICNVYTLLFFPVPFLLRSYLSFWL